MRALLLDIISRIFASAPWLAARSDAKAIRFSAAESLAAQSKAWAERELSGEEIAGLGAILSGEVCGMCGGRDDPSECLRDHAVYWLEDNFDECTLAKIARSCRMSAAVAETLADSRSPAVREELAKNAGAIGGRERVQLKLAKDKARAVRQSLACFDGLFESVQRSLAKNGGRVVRNLLANNPCLRPSVAHIILDASKGEKRGEAAESVAENVGALRGQLSLQLRLADDENDALPSALAGNQSLLQEAAAVIVFRPDDDLSDDSPRRALAWNVPFLSERLEYRVALALDTNGWVSMGIDLSRFETGQPQNEEEVSGTPVDTCPWPEVPILAWCVEGRPPDLSSYDEAAAPFAGMSLEANGDLVVVPGLSLSFDSASMRWSHDCGPRFPHAAKLNMSYADLPAPARDIVWRDANANPSLSWLADALLEEKMMA